jgi:hypothetical protein
MTFTAHVIMAFELAGVTDGNEDPAGLGYPGRDRVAQGGDQPDQAGALCRQA